MYAAYIEIGWVKKWFKGNSPREIMQEVENVQDFECLLRMGRVHETKKGQKQLDKLEEFLKKYWDNTLTMDDIKKLNIHLKNNNNICCHQIVEGEEAESK